MKRGLGVLAAVSVAWGVACGGGSANKEPAAPKSAAAGDAGAESFAEVNPADVAELGGAKDAGASAASEPAAPAAAAAPADECAPVGVDFEKRARPKIKECYREGKKKDPDLKGSIKISLEIDYQGKTKGPKIVESTLPKAVSKCMLDAVKATPIPEAAKCPNKTVAIPVTFPTPP